MNGFMCVVVQDKHFAYAPQLSVSPWVFTVSGAIYSCPQRFAVELHVLQNQCVSTGPQETKKKTTDHTKRRKGILLYIISRRRYAYCTCCAQHTLPLIPRAQE